MRHLLVLFLVLSFFASPAFAEDDASIYEVTDVAVDITADSAAHARDQAIAEAQRTAFSQLIDRLGANAAVATKLSDDDLSTLVQNFEVQNERTSAVRYIGTFTVHFRPTAVRNLLGNHNSDYAEERSKPVLVLPIFITNGHPVLWEDKTKWRTAWETNARGSGLVPVVVPAGDLNDISLISTTEAATGKTASLEAMMHKYQTNGIAVATLDADLDKLSGDFKVDIVHYDFKGIALPTVHLTLHAPADKSILDSALIQAVKQVRRQLEKDWRDHPQTDDTDTVNDDTPQPGEATQEEATTHLPVQVTIKTLAQWAGIKRTLDSVPLINRTNVIVLQRGSTSIELEFHGGLDALQIALSQQGLSLDQDNGNGVWTLRPVTPDTPY